MKCRRCGSPAEQVGEAPGDFYCHGGCGDLFYDQVDWTPTPVEYTEPCPVCLTPDSVVGAAGGSGVVCRAPGCRYWFCY